jgi:hypothetical protein
VAKRAKGQHNRFHKIVYHSDLFVIINISGMYSVLLARISALRRLAPRLALSFADATAAIGQAPNENKAAISAER